MAVKYTEEQLHTIDKPVLIQMLVQSQEQAGLRRRWLTQSRFAFRKSMETSYSSTKQKLSVNRTLLSWKISP